MTSFGNPLRPMPGAFSLSPGNMAPPLSELVGSRIALVRPASARILSPGETLEWAAGTDIKGVTHLLWEVSAVRESRSPEHPHFWYEFEDPYFQTSRLLPLSDTFTLSAEEAASGYSTWRVSVTPLQMEEDAPSVGIGLGEMIMGSMVDIEDLLSGGESPSATGAITYDAAAAFFSINRAMLRTSAVLLDDVVAPSSLADVGVVPVPYPVTTEATVSMQLEPPELAIASDPAFLLDPSPVS